MSGDQQVAFSSARSRMKDSDWWALITSIREQRLIPVIGPSVIRVPFADRSITYERYISQELAEDPDYKLVEEDFQQLGVTFDQATLRPQIKVNPAMPKPFPGTKDRRMAHTLSSNCVRHCG